MGKRAVAVMYLFDFGPHGIETEAGGKRFDRALVDALDSNAVRCALMEAIWNDSDFHPRTFTVQDVGTPKTKTRRR
jgi:hypothetical protein